MAHEIEINPSYQPRGVIVKTMAMPAALPYQYVNGWLFRGWRLMAGGSA
jgi:hypothetical protein